MTAAQVLEDLRRRGARVWSDQGELRISAPKGAVDKSLLDAASAQKATLIELLAPANAAGAMPPPDAPEAPDLIRLADVPDYRPDETPDFVRHVAPYRGFLYHMLGVDKTFVRGAGDWLYEADGTATADFVAQFGALPFGHDPNDIWKAVAAYRASGQPNLAISSIQPAAGSLAARLVDLAPEGLCHVTFANSGAEAVEIALKLAHCATGRPGILSFKNGFHGLTLGTMSATGDGFFQRGFGAPVLGFDYVPFGDLAALEALLAQRPQHFAAFLVEIIQGGGGMTTLPEGFLQAAQKLCRDYGVLLIIDEVQTGLGRTGRLFACEEEGVAPDILTLAKALGGGLVPVGACLFSAEVFREDFDLRHGSTFAGNALACHTGLATLELLTRDDRAVVRSAAAMGAHLRAGLEALQRKYPHLIAEIRGRGLMLGVVLTLDPIVERRAGLLAVLQQQNLLFNICVSYLLNQQHMRVAPSISGGTVLRIEPPLTVAPETCDALLSALETLLGVLDRADAGALLAHFMPEAQPGATRTAHPAVAATPRPAVQAEEAERFAFVAHLLSIDDLGRFDASLAGVGAAGLQGLRDRIKPFLRPFPMGQLQIDATTGRTARGETIILPHLPDELMAMSGDAAVALVDDAVRLAASRGAKVVGLGGFSSIVSAGGLALSPPPGVRVTSGNSLTALAAVRAVTSVLAERGGSLEGTTVSVVGAAGAIGRGIALLAARGGARITLIGRPGTTHQSLDRLAAVAEECARAHSESARPEVTTDAEAALPAAEVVFTATNAVTPFLETRALRRNAVVCDVSRPYNLIDRLDVRPDLSLLRGGVVQAPDGAELDALAEPDLSTAIVACAAETIVLTLSGYDGAHLCGQLDLDEILRIGAAAEAAGFRLDADPSLTRR